ncbi:MAG: hypothetical protein ACLTCI_07585 [[Clostridium] nexile]
MTNKNFDVLVDHTDNVSFEVASEKVEYVGFSVKKKSASIVYQDTNRKIIRNYTDLTENRPSTYMVIRTLAYNFIYNKL